MNRKKIIIGYDFLNEIGGLERVMFFMANCLSEEYDVELSFLYVNEKRKEEIIRALELNPNIKINPLYPDKSQSSALLKGFLFQKELDCDLIISNSFLFSKIANKSLKNKIPYVIIMHHPPNFLYSAVSLKKWANNPSRIFAFLLGKTMRNRLKKQDIKYVNQSNCVIVSSNYTKERIKKIYNINPEMIYPPVSKFFKPENKDKMKKILDKYNINEPFILFHGRTIPDKRPELFIETAEKLVNLHRVKINFIMSGDISDKMKEELNKIIKEKKLENVKLLGRVSNDELKALYNLAEVFVVTAPKEDFGLTPIEAMACGCPVVAWNDNAGPNETVIEGKSGMFALPYDTKDMADKIKFMLDNNFKKSKKLDILNNAKRFSEKNVKKIILKEIKMILGE